MKWYLKACPTCGGDLHEDLEDPGFVTCFLCGRSFRTRQSDGVRRTGWRRGVNDRSADDIRPAA